MTPKAEVFAAMDAVNEALMPLAGQHPPRAVAVALAAVLGGMAAELHRAGQLRPALAESLGVVTDSVTSGVHGQIAARAGGQPGGRA
jgi:CBS-domain-containing membrane protein